jgi:hypothetical protein
MESGELERSAIVVVLAVVTLGVSGFPRAWCCRVSLPFVHANRVGVEPTREGCALWVCSLREK